jgi:hypothetical protein
MRGINSSYPDMNPGGVQTSSSQTRTAINHTQIRTGSLAGQTATAVASNSGTDPPSILAAATGSGSAGSRWLDNNGKKASAGAGAFCLREDPNQPACQQVINSFDLYRRDSDRKDQLPRQHRAKLMPCDQTRHCPSACGDKVRPQTVDLRKPEMHVEPECRGCTHGNECGKNTDDEIGRELIEPSQEPGRYKSACDPGCCREGQTHKHTHLSSPAQASAAVSPFESVSMHTAVGE